MAWTKEEVLLNKNNMIIASFMGAVILSPETKFSYVQYPMDAWVTDIGTHKETYKQKLHSKQLEYHESYNWIIPVVEKIESLGYDTELVYRLDDGGHCFYINDSPVFSSQMGSKIEAIYKAVLEFINWYNTQNRKDK